MSMDDLTRAQEIDGKFVDLVDKPFLYAFKEDQHVIDSYEPNPHLNILCSWDFKKDPMTCLIGQKPNVRTLIVFDESTMRNGSTPELCDVIAAKHKDWRFKIEITGDASGRNRSPLLVGNVNHYSIIKQKFQLKEREMLQRDKNPDHSTSRILFNSVLQNGVFRITKNCKQTINDMLYANVDDEGSLIKSVDQGLHHIDCARYAVDAAFPNFLEKPWIYANPKT